jgi:hypothetical protein
VYKDDTSFIEGDWTQGQDFQVGLDWTPAFGELAVELIGNIKFVYPSSNGTTTKYLNNISLTQKFAPTPSYVFNTTQQTVSGSEGFKQHFRSAYLPGGSVLAIRETYMETPIVVNIDWSNLDTSNWSKRPDYY